jgi:hypothetical protein
MTIFRRNRKPLMKWRGMELNVVKLMGNLFPMIQPILKVHLKNMRMVQHWIFFLVAGRNVTMSTSLFGPMTKLLLMSEECRTKAVAIGCGKSVFFFFL